MAERKDEIAGALRQLLVCQSRLDDVKRKIRRDIRRHPNDEFGFLPKMQAHKEKANGAIFDAWRNARAVALAAGIIAAEEHINVAHRTFDE